MQEAVRLAFYELWDALVTLGKGAEGPARASERDVPPCVG